VDILLGYDTREGHAGEEVRIPLQHTAIFGMTQLSGKTTALEAIITRSGLRAVAFITKRGEGSFKNGNQTIPFYKPRADWQYVEGLINVALNERVKYEPGMRSAIMRVCNESAGRGILPADSLDTVRKNARQMALTAKGEFMKSVYDRLAAYLDIVVPELARYKFSTKLNLKLGVNVMSLADMRTETQHLVIASTIQEINETLDHTILVIPEAWETLPQSRMTPVKLVAQQFVRKGAALGNYMFLDSQDCGGLDKTPLRQVDNWLIGRMRESNEIVRLSKQVLGATLLPGELQTLKVGHFIAVIGDQVRRVYVLPAGVPEEMGIKVAKGQMTVEEVSLQMQADDPQRLHPVKLPMTPEEALPVAEYDRRSEKLEKRLDSLEKEVAYLEHGASGG